MSDTNRKHALTKVTAGDYLLPSNDGRTLWRIVQSEETVPVESGHDITRDQTTKTVLLWSTWRWTRSMPGLPIDADLVGLDWEDWELTEQWLPKRADAIKAVLRWAPRSDRQPNYSERKISVGGSELGRAACLVAEIVKGREAGNRDERAGNSDEDLLGAVEELESEIRNWRASR